MATMNVKDAAGQTVAIEKPLAPNRAAAMLSRPVVLSNEDKAVLDAILAKLIAAPATEASLASAVTLLTAIGGVLSGSLTVNTISGFALEAGNLADIKGLLAKAATGTLSNVSSSGSDTTILAANANRKGGLIFNDSTEVLYLRFGTGTA